MSASSLEDSSPLMCSKQVTMGVEGQTAKRSSTRSFQSGQRGGSRAMRSSLLVDEINSPLKRPSSGSERESAILVSTVPIERTARKTPPRRLEMTISCSEFEQMESSLSAMLIPINLSGARLRRSALTSARMRER